MIQLLLQKHTNFDFSCSLIENRYKIDQSQKLASYSELNYMNLILLIGKNLEHDEKDLSRTYTVWT